MVDSDRRPYWVLTEATGAGDILCLTRDGKRLRRAHGEPTPAMRLDVDALALEPGVLDQVIEAATGGTVVAITDDDRVVAYLVPPPEAPDEKPENRRT